MTVSPWARFGSKRFCCCLGESYLEVLAKTAKTYAAYPDSKIAVCAIAVAYPDAHTAGHPPAGDASGEVVGFAQLTFADLPADGELPEFIRHRCAPDEGYLEQIVVLDKMRGRGVGKRLLDWVDETCRARWVALPLEAAAPSGGGGTVEALVHAAPRTGRVTLGVVCGNPAILLYERHGYVRKRECCMTSCCVSFLTLWLMRKSGAYDMTKTL